jgi:hypothetical protein
VVLNAGHVPMDLYHFLTVTQVDACVVKILSLMTTQALATLVTTITITFFINGRSIWFSMKEDWECARSALTIQSFQQLKVSKERSSVPAKQA